MPSASQKQISSSSLPYFLLMAQSYSKETGSPKIISEPVSIFSE
jgi:hypothetical protein